jgi:glycosyltransferase involved in cell wall biosynthesis
VSLIEAQASGKPIVSTNVGGIENIVIPNETALLSETGDKTTFFNNLDTLVNNCDLRNKMSEKGWEFVQKKFHYSRLVENTADYYEQLLRENSNR